MLQRQFSSLFRKKILKLFSYLCFSKNKLTLLLFNLQNVSHEGEYSKGFFTNEGHGRILKSKLCGTFQNYWGGLLNCEAGSSSQRLRFGRSDRERGDADAVVSEPSEKHCSTSAGQVVKRMKTIKNLHFSLSHPKDEQVSYLWPIINCLHRVSPFLTVDDSSENHKGKKLLSREVFLP